VKCTKVGVLLMCLAFLSACETSPKKAAVLIPPLPTETAQAPVFSETLKAEFARANQLFSTGDFKQAKTLYQKLLDIEPRMSGAYVNLGLIAQRSDELEEARTLFEQALSINPRNPHANMALALGYLKEGDFDRAEQGFKRVLVLDATHANAHYNLAVLYELYRQDFAQAIEHYNGYLAHTSDANTDTVRRWIKLLERK